VPTDEAADGCRFARVVLSSAISCVTAPRPMVSVRSRPLDTLHQGAAGKLVS